MIKVIIADDHPLMRESIKSAIETNSSDIVVVGSFSNGIEVLSFLQHTPPDVILLDIDMPELDGFETLKQIREKFGDKFKVLIFSAHTSNFINLRLMQLGADGILFKKSTSDELTSTIRSISKGTVVFQNSTAYKMAFGVKKSIAMELDDFNATEISILKLMCEQQNAKEIAAKLGLSANSINKYRAILMEKTNSSNMAGMVIFAIKHGIYKIPE
jgi:DNA-binding NarL/FixJ family response regulator